MKKNGFIATSILYSFFLVFLTLFVALIANYLHNRILLSKINESSLELLYKVNNTKITDLKVGDKIKFDTNTKILSPDGIWTIAYISTVDNVKTYYFISDLKAQRPYVLYKFSDEKIEKAHPMTIDLYQRLSSEGAYDKAINYDGFNITIVTSSFLNTIRKNTENSSVLESIFDVGGNYVVFINNDIKGTAYNTPLTNYVQDTYYLMKKYNLSYDELTLIPKYCGGTFNGSKVNYYTSNTFGYMNTINETVVNGKYVNYCYYASPLYYNHPASENVIDISESNTSDQIKSIYDNNYSFRLVASISLDINQENTYLDAGKGTSLDPYVFTDGVGD